MPSRPHHLPPSASLPLSPAANLRLRAMRNFLTPLIAAAMVPAGCVAQTSTTATGGPAPLTPTTFSSSLTTAAPVDAKSGGSAIGFPEYPTLTPDGRWVIFNWAGDLWAMRADADNSAGAVRITANPAEERRCAVSPDGRSLAFESDREGARNIYIIPIRTDGATFEAGPATRITTSDRAEGLGGFSADGKSILFAGDRSPSIHNAAKLYRVELIEENGALRGGPVTELTSAFGSSPRPYSADGRSFLFTRNRAGLERPKYRGSGTQDVWLLRTTPASTPDAQPLADFTPVTQNAANDAEAFARPDGSVVFISSRDGQNNLWSALPKGDTFDDAGAKQLTFFAPTRDQYTIAHGVRDLAVSTDGRLAVFAVWDRLYRLDLSDANAKPIALDLRAAAGADAGFMDRERRSLDKDVSEAALSPDGKTLAVVARGEVFIRSTQEGYPTRRVTFTTGRERDLSWSPDGEFLYFASDERAANNTNDARPAEGGANALFRAKVTLAREDLAAKPATPKKAEPKPDDATKPAAEPKPTDPKSVPPTSPTADPTAPATAPAPEPKPEDPATSGATPAATPTTDPAPEAKKSDDTAKDAAPKKDAKDTKKEEEGPDPGKRWAESLRFEVEPVEAIADDARVPLVSPDGKHLVYVRGLGDVVIRDLTPRAETKDASKSTAAPLTGAERVIIQSVLGPEVQWTADSRHLIATITDLDYNSDIWIVDTLPADTADAPPAPAQSSDAKSETASETKPSEKTDTKSDVKEEKQDRTGWEKLSTGVWAVNITRHPDNDSSPRLSADGKVLVFLSERAAQDDEQDVWAVYLDKDLEGKAGYEVDDYFKKAAEAAGKRKPLAIAKAAATKPKADEAKSSEAPKPDAEKKDAETKPADSKKDDSKKDEAKKPEAPKPLRFDAGDAYLRVRRITSMAGSEGNLEMTPGADRIIFSASIDGERSLFSVDQKGKDRKPLIAGDVRDVRVSLTGDKVSFIKSGVANTTPKAGGKVEPLAIEAPVVIDVAAQQRQKFLEAARLLGTGFYHPTLKGLDWPRLTTRYAELAERTRTSATFNRVTQMLFGELDGSHTGIGGGDRFTPPGGPVATGYLGVRVTPVKGGYLVRDVTLGSPADEPTTRIRVGETIVSIDGQKFSPADDALPTLDFSTAFAGKAGKEILVEVRPKAGDSASASSSASAASPEAEAGAHTAPNTRLVLIIPVSYMAWDALDYQDEVLRRRAVVEKLSNGRLGYLHIRSMGEESVREFERDLFAAASGKDGLIIDVRDNGGGYTADILLASLTAPNHAYTAPRGVDPAKVRKDSYPRDRRLIYGWSRPINVLINQNSFSNAEIFAHAIKTIGRGKLVGTATFGGVISTGASVLVDGTMVRTPFRGWYLPDGSDQENNGAQPDVNIPQTPSDEATHTDTQLRAAVEELLKRIPTTAAK